MVDRSGPGLSCLICLNCYHYSCMFLPTLIKLEVENDTAKPFMIHFKAENEPAPACSMDPQKSLSGVKKGEKNV